MTVSPEHAEIALPLIRDLIDRDWPSPDTLEWSALSAVQEELEWIIRGEHIAKKMTHQRIVEVADLESAIDHIEGRAAFLYEQGRPHLATIAYDLVAQFESLIEKDN